VHYILNVVTPAQENMAISAKLAGADRKIVVDVGQSGGEKRTRIGSKR
jgi:hypothetical protein